MGNKVLVPLDGSELAEAALAYAERLNKALGWTVVLLQVAQPPSAHHGHGGNPLLEGSLQELQQEEAGGPRAYEEIRRRVQEALTKLDEIDREVLQLRAFEGLENEEVAQVLGLEPGTASKRYGRALLRLRKALAG